MEDPREPVVTEFSAPGRDALNKLDVGLLGGAVAVPGENNPPFAFAPDAAGDMLCAPGLLWAATPLG